MRRARLALLPLLVLLAAAPARADPVIRSVFVGIDKYRYSRAQLGSDATFDDLRGAVADVMLVKRALGLALSLQLDQPVPGACRSANALSVTLTDGCATRAEILNTLTDQVRRAAPGDTVLFYYAGHGSTLADDAIHDQAGGYNSTLLPSDARPPDRPGSNDIYDREIGALIDVANARGVHFVTLFDACNSGTGTRGEGGDGDSRGVKPIKVKGRAMWRPDLAPTGPGGGYRVHFGAADDTETAREVASGGSVDGVFTVAFTQALLANPQATFGDLATAVRLKLQQDGRMSQHPQAEGQLVARFGGTARPEVLYDARPDGSGVRLGAGRILGMTPGSTFALYSSQTAALDPAARPLTSGMITALEDGTASLTLDQPPAAPLPAELIARETAHRYGADRLRIELREGVPPEQSKLAAALTRLEFVEIAPRGAPADYYFLRRSPDEAGPVRLYSRDGAGLATMGEVSDPGFAAGLQTALLTIYKVRQLLALPARSSSDAGVMLCLSTQLDHPVQSCPEPANAPRRVPVDTPLVLTVTNASEQARYINVLVIDDKLGVTQLIPSGQGMDKPMARWARQRLSAFKFDSDGLYRFVIFTSDQRINTAVLQQAALRQRPCDPAQERCDPGGGGARDAAVPSLGSWTITVEDAMIELPKVKP